MKILAACISDVQHEQGLDFGLHAIIKGAFFGRRKFAAEAILLSDPIATVKIVSLVGFSPQRIHNQRQIIPAPFCENLFFNFLHVSQVCLSVGPKLFVAGPCRERELRPGDRGEHVSVVCVGLPIIGNHFSFVYSRLETAF